MQILVTQTLDRKTGVLSTTSKFSLDGEDREVKSETKLTTELADLYLMSNGGKDVCEFNAEVSEADLRVLLEE